MNSARIQTGEIEPIEVYVVDSMNNPLKGKTDLYLRVRRKSDDYYLDWNDMTFKAVGWTLRDRNLTEIDATLSPGLYKIPPGFDTSLITNPATDDTYIMLVVQTPGTDAILPEPGVLKVGRWLDYIQPPADIVDLIWDELLAGHTVVGSTGEALGNWAFGKVGARQIDITVEDTGAAPIQGVAVDIYDSTNTYHLVRLFTDINGQVTVALDDGTYKVRLSRSGFSFNVTETLVVSADAGVTWTGTALAGAIVPSAPNLCLVYGTIRDARGLPVSGTCVEAYAVTPQTVSGVQKAERIGTTRTDTNGTFEMELVRTTVVWFTIEGTGFDFQRTVPDAPTQDVATWT